MRLDQGPRRPLELAGDEREVVAAVGPGHERRVPDVAEHGEDVGYAASAARSTRIVSPIEPICRCTSSELSCTPLSADDSARTSAMLSFG